MASTRAGLGVESVTYQQDTETYRLEYDQDTTPASLAVVAALSDAMDVDPIELAPLQTTVDTDALNTLTGVRATTTGAVTIAFTHEGWTITVHSHGVVTIAPVAHEQTDDQPTHITYQ